MVRYLYLIYQWRDQQERIAQYVTKKKRQTLTESICPFSGSLYARIALCYIMFKIFVVQF